jgi:hypothetical protein
MITLPTDAELSRAFFRKENEAALEEIIRHRLELQYNTTNTLGPGRYAGNILLDGKILLNGKNFDYPTYFDLEARSCYRRQLRVAMRERIIPEIQHALEASEPIPLPKLTFHDEECEYHAGMYNPETKTIGLKPIWANTPEGFKTMEAVLFHEAVHHTADHIIGLNKISLLEDQGIFNEGHVIGVENTANNTPHGIYSPFIYTMHTDYLIRAIEHLQNGNTPCDDALLGIKKKRHICMCAYDIGFALFSIKELEYGPSIYGEALRNPMILLQ